MAASKDTHRLARQLLKLSLVDGRVAPDRVGGVLAYIEKHRPAQPLALLKAYQRLIAAELAKGQAVVEHAGVVSETLLQTIAAAMSKKYGRPISASARANAALLAGLRVRVGDDVYESSVSGQLAALSANV